MTRGTWTQGKKRIGLGLLILGIWTAVLTAQEPARLTLRSQSTVWSDQVLLKDLVDNPETLTAEMGNLLVGAAPRPGQTESFSSEEIRHKLRANQMDVAGIDGSKQVLVRRDCREIDPVTFQKEIRDYIAAQIPRNERLAVEVTSTQPILEPGRLNWRLHPARGQEFIGTMLFSLEGVNPLNGQVVVQRWINVKVSRESRLAVSNRSLARGEELSASDVRYEWRSLTPSTIGAYCRDNPPVGRRVERNLPANQVVTLAYIRKEFLVQRGVTATLSARSGGVTASAPVQVLENGVGGQWVLVQNLRSSKTFRARVCGKHKLEVLIQ